MTNEEKKNRVASLYQLIDSAGWSIICEELDEDIKLTEAKLHGEVPLQDKETIELLQRERIDRIELRSLPSNLIREYSEESADVDNEVY